MAQETENRQQYISRFCESNEERFKDWFSVLAGTKSELANEDIRQIGLTFWTILEKKGHLPAPESSTCSRKRLRATEDEDEDGGVGVREVKLVQSRAKGKVAVNPHIQPGMGRSQGEVSTERTFTSSDERECSSTRVNTARRAPRTRRPRSQVAQRTSTEITAHDLRILEEDPEGMKRRAKENWEAKRAVAMGYFAPSQSAVPEPANSILPPTINPPAVVHGTTALPSMQLQGTPHAHFVGGPTSPPTRQLQLPGDQAAIAPMHGPQGFYQSLFQTSSMTSLDNTSGHSSSIPRSATSSLSHTPSVSRSLVPLDATPSLVPNSRCGPTSMVQPYSRHPSSVDTSPIGTYKTVSNAVSEPIGHRIFGWTSSLHPLPELIEIPPTNSASTSRLPFVQPWATPENIDKCQPPTGTSSETVDKIDETNSPTGSLSSSSVTPISTVTPPSTRPWSTQLPATPADGTHTEQTTTQSYIGEPPNDISNSKDLTDAMWDSLFPLNFPREGDHNLPSSNGMP